MTITPNLHLPYIAAAQAQKHVTHNEALRALDAIIQLSVLDRDLATPPGSPANGDRYIIAASPTGAWSGQAGKIAAFQDGAWAFFTPKEGWIVWVADEGSLVARDGSAWVAAGGGSSGLTFNPATDGLVGVNATADIMNRLAVSSPASLFNHEGAGHQLKINKAAAGDTASVLFQTNWSGRAEFGLAGNDDWSVKVSPDGTTWHDALIVDRDTGAVTLPNTPAFSPLSLWDFWIEQPALGPGTFSGNLSGQFRGAALNGGAVHSFTSAMPDGPTGIGSGQHCFRSGTAVDSGSTIQTPRMNGDVLGAQSRKFRSQLMWHDDIADSFVRCGAMSGASANTARSSFASAVYFEIDGSTCSAIATDSTSTHTVHPTTITLSQAVQYTFEIDIAADGSEARYRVWAGTSETPILDVTNTTNIPGLTGTLGWAVTAITKVAAAARNIATLYSIGYGTIAGYHRATGRV